MEQTDMSGLINSGNITMYANQVKSLWCCIYNIFGCTTLVVHLQGRLRFMGSNKKYILYLPSVNVMLTIFQPMHWQLMWLILLWNCSFITNKTTLIWCICMHAYMYQWIQFQWYIVTILNQWTATVSKQLQSFYNVHQLTTFRRANSPWQSGLCLLMNTYKHNNF